MAANEHYRDGVRIVVDALLAIVEANSHVELVIAEPGMIYGGMKLRAAAPIDDRRAVRGELLIDLLQISRSDDCDSRLADELRKALAIAAQAQQIRNATQREQEPTPCQPQ
ncbi:MAG: hypothetical protein HYX69_18670 [Planctomycetia bacterium]|nr:hypothetical protein [Planctomycetia bacterium]